MHVLVLAKEPVAGGVKTRLCPPLEAAQAAQVAEAALADTLDAVARCGASRRVLALDGRPGPWLPAGFEVIDQRGRGLAARLGAAWADADGPGVQIGMDTPQVTPALLDDALARLERGSPDRAVLGPASDGGWWCIGMRSATPGVFDGVAMSTSETGLAQARRLRALGREVELLTELRDIDTIEDLAHVVGLIPASRTAAVAAALDIPAVLSDRAVRVGVGSGRRHDCLRY